jgi:hypothetical protein
LFKKDNASYCGAGGAASHIIKEYISPADDTVPNGTKITVKIKVPSPPDPFKAEFSGTYATTSYAANGLVFGSNSGGMPRTFVDGTSNTIMFAERAQACSFNKVSGATGADDAVAASAEEVVYNLWAFGTYGPSTPSYALLTPPELNAKGVSSSGQIAPALPLPANWSDKPMKIRTGFQIAEIVDPPAGVPFQILTDKTPCLPGTLQTPHKQGMLVALGDGSLRTISPKISQWTFWAATTPNGNETLGTDW